MCYSPWQQLNEKSFSGLLDVLLCLDARGLILLGLSSQGSYQTSGRKTPHFSSQPQRTRRVKALFCKVRVIQSGAISAICSVKRKAKQRTTVRCEFCSYFEFRKVLYNWEHQRFVKKAPIKCLSFNFLSFPPGKTFPLDLYFSFDNPTPTYLCNVVHIYLIH